METSTPSIRKSLSQDCPSMDVSSSRCKWDYPWASHLSQPDPTTNWWKILGNPPNITWVKWDPSIPLNKRHCMKHNYKVSHSYTAPTAYTRHGIHQNSM
uniref:Uncharacterized protein n=1 Tax=Aegilops tauschii subsp. strangulata TaxID=200361 RepID=A0A453ERN8_AEGTS